MDSTRPKRATKLPKRYLDSQDPALASSEVTEPTVKRQRRSKPFKPIAVEPLPEPLPQPELLEEPLPTYNLLAWHPWQGVSLYLVHLATLFNQSINQSINHH